MKRCLISSKKLLIHSLLFCCLCLFTTSCKTKKETVGTSEIKDIKELFSFISENSFEYKTLSGKMKADIRLGKNNIAATGILRIIKDEKLLFSLQAPLFGEVFRLAISNDSLVVIDRMNKQFVAESTKKDQTNNIFRFRLKQFAITLYQPDFYS